MRATLVLAGVMALTAAAAYAYVAVRLGAREGGRRRPMAMFQLWWGALALNLALVAATYLLGAFDLLTFEMQLADAYLQRLLLCVSMVGLMHYLLFLLTGRDLLVPLIIAYAIYYLLIVGSLAAQEPARLFVGAWRTDVAYAEPEVPYMALASLAFILLPPTIASVAYFRLFFRLKDPSRRWRIALVSVSILVWWAVAVVAGQRALLDVGPVQVANRALSVAAAFAVLLAYHPPAWARRRWGVGEPRT